MSAIYLTLALTCFSPLDPAAPVLDSGMPESLFGIDLAALEQIPTPFGPVGSSLRSPPVDTASESQRETGALSRGGRRTDDDRTASRTEPPATAPLAQLRNRPVSFHPAHISRTNLFCIFLC